MVYSTVTLTGKIKRGTAPAVGTAILTPTVNSVSDMDGNEVLYGPLVATLDVNDGSFSIIAPATDDANLNPQNFGYTLSFELEEGTLPDIPEFSLPAAQVTIDITDIIPDPANPTYVPTLTGPPNELTVGTVTTGAAGSAAAVTITGESPDQTISFVIPQGLKGDKGDQGLKGDTGTAATISVGTVTTGAPGTPADVDNSGTPQAAIFDFVIPKGDKGDKGDPGSIDNASQLTIEGIDPAVVPLTVQGAAGQVANIQEWEDDLGNILAYINSLGTLRVAGAEFTNDISIKHANSPRIVIEDTTAVTGAKFRILQIDNITYIQVDTTGDGAYVSVYRIVADAGEADSYMAMDRRLHLKSYRETLTVLPNQVAGGTWTVDPSLSSMFLVDCSAGSTTMAIAAAVEGDSFWLRIFMNPARAVTWPASIKWLGGVAPTLELGHNIFSFVYEGGVWWGSIAGTTP